MNLRAAWLFAAVGCVALGCVVLGSGCSGLDPAPRPTIDSLFQQAVTKNANNPENTGVTEVDSPTSAERKNRLPGEEELPPPPIAGFSSKLVAGKMINETFQDTDVREAIQTLADDAKVSVIMDEKLKGNVTANIETPDIEVAFDKVLSPLGLVFAKREGQYLVATSDPEGPLFYRIAEHREFRPQHHPAIEIVAVLPERLKKYVRVVEKANLIAVDAPKTHTQIILERFRQVDQPIPQVLLEAIVCVISPECNFRFGLDWSHAVPIDGKDAFSVGVQGLGISGNYTKAGGRQVFSDFATTQTFVKLLAENGYLSIRAAPRVMAKDGDKANISISRETFFSGQQANSGTTSNPSNSFILQNNVQKVDSGIVLAMTPQIRGETVTVNIEKAEVSEDTTNTANTTSTSAYPIINRRSVSTTVHVQDGKTIVIGGLVQRQMVENINRVPGLSSLPLVGNMFKSVQRQEKDVEVVIFISPRIVLPEIAMERGPATPIKR